MSEAVENRTDRPGPPGETPPRGGALRFLRGGGALFLRQREATVLVVAVIYMLSNLGADVIVALLNPRVRYGR